MMSADAVLIAQKGECLQVELGGPFPLALFPDQSVTAAAGEVELSFEGLDEGGAKSLSFLLANPTRLEDRVESVEGAAIVSLKADGSLVVWPGSKTPLHLSSGQSVTLALCKSGEIELSFGGMNPGEEAIARDMMMLGAAGTATDAAWDVNDPATPEA